jgi:hypothetical protein
VAGTSPEARGWSRPNINVVALYPWLMLPGVPVILPFPVAARTTSPTLIVRDEPLRRWHSEGRSNRNEQNAYPR